jgi:hypothetical protein
VVGSYGHSVMHELLPGSTTSRLLRISPFPCSSRTRYARACICLAITPARD